MDYALKLHEQQVRLKELEAQRELLRKVDCFDRTFEWEYQCADVNLKIDEATSYIAFYQSMITVVDRS